jgi:hypothetical protein
MFEQKTLSVLKKSLHSMTATLDTRLAHWFPGLRVERVSQLYLKGWTQPAGSDIQPILQMELDRIRDSCFDTIYPTEISANRPTDIQLEHMLPHCTFYLHETRDRHNWHFALVCHNLNAVLDAALGRKYYCV